MNNKKDILDIKKARKILADQVINHYLKSLTEEERQQMVNEFFERTYNNVR